MVRRTISKIYIGIILAFLYLPILVLIILSFNNSKSRVQWGGFTLDWYKEIFTSSTIISAFGTTLVLAIGSALIATIIGLAAAVGIDAMKKRQYAVMMGATNIPMLNADIVIGISMMLFFVKFIPLGFSSLFLAHVTFNIPYVILSILPKLQRVDANIYEAARDLGASGFKAFFKVVIPCIKSGILSGFLMAMTISLDDFVVTYFTKGAGVNTLSTMIYGELRKGIKPEMYALSTVLFLLILLILLFVNKTSKKDIIKED